MAGPMLIKYFRAAWSRIHYNPDDEMDIKGKVVIVTGSNSGIGAVTALEMAKRGAIVVMVCRDIVKAEKVVQEIKSKAPGSRIELLELDLGDLSSVRKCAEEIKLKFPRIDILVNNAGLIQDEWKDKRTKDGFEVHMGVNHLGHFLFTNLLLDNIKKGAPGARIVNVSSGTFEIGKVDVDNLMLEKTKASLSDEHIVPYSNSKLANVYFTRALAKNLEGTGVTVYALCPGLVYTDLGRGTDLGWLKKKLVSWVALTPEQGTETTLHCSLSNKCGNESGLVYRFCKPWENMPELDTEVERKLWEKSAQLVVL